MKSVQFCAALLLCSVFMAPPVLAGISVEASKDRNASDATQIAGAMGSAAMEDNGAGKTDAESVFALGVDISGAGSTPEALIAFFQQLPSFQQANVRTRCVAMAADQPDASTPPVKSFCDAVLRSK